MESRLKQSTVLKEIARDAGSRTATLLWSDGKALIRSAILAAVGFFAAWWAFGFSQASAKLPEIAVTVAVVAVLVVPVFCYEFLVAVADRAIADKSTMDELRSAIRPNLDVGLVNEGKPIEMPVGNILQTDRGPVANRSGRAPAICLAVTNKSKKQANGVKAWLTSLEGDNGSRLAAPVQLIWRASPERDHSTQILGQTTTQLQIFKLDYGNIQIATPMPSVDHVGFFGGGGVFKGKISISDNNQTYLAVNFEFDGDDHEIRNFVVERGVD